MAAVAGAEVVKDSKPVIGALAPAGDAVISVRRRPSLPINVVYISSRWRG